MSVKILNEGFDKLFNSLNEESMADKVKSNQNKKEMTRRAIKTLKDKGGKYKDLEKEFEDSYGEKCLDEDTVKQNGKWVNKGKEGTHGKFKTKKAADAQRKAMFANGYKAEGLRRKPMRESEKEIKRYSDVRPRSERKYWYFTTHGVQPGSIPRDLNVLEVRDGQNDKGTWGTYVMLDGVLNTSELKKYDMRELVPPMRESRSSFVKKTNLENINKKKIRESNGLKESEDEIEYEKKYYSAKRPDGSGEIDYWEVESPKNPKDWGRGERNRTFLDRKEWQKRAFGINESKKLNESFDDMEVFMNTWANYNEYGADGVLTPTGWMSIDDAIEYCEEYAEYEPFINDTDNVPFDVSEYSNASSVLQDLKELQDSNVDEDVVEAIVEAGGYDVKEAVEIAESGDYYFYPDVHDYSDLAYAVIDEIGSLKDALGDRITNYIDEDQMRREYSWDVRDMMRDDAESAVDEEHVGEVDIAVAPTSKEFNIDEWFDEDDEYTEDDLREQISDDLEFDYGATPVSFDIEVSSDGKKVTAKNIEWDGYDREQEIEDWIDEHEDDYLDSIIDEEISLAEAGEVDLSNYFDYEAYGRDLSYDGYTFTDKGAILIM